MKVVSKQKNSKMCYICGVENTVGLRASFYNMEDNSVMTKFSFKEEHQSFPERVHGGLVSTMLDELACRAYWVEHPEEMGVTMSMEVKYRKPVPYNVELIGKGIISKELSKMFVSEVQILDKDGTVYADGVVKYLKMPIDKITDYEVHDDDMFLVPDDIVEI